MFRLVFRQLTLDPLRTALTVCALGAMVTVLLTLEGFKEGLVAQLGDAVINRRADLIITQAGVGNFIAARSVLPQYTRRDVEAIEGVAAAHPVTGIPLIYRRDERSTPIFLLVYDGRGGPVRLTEGSEIAAPREIVVDRSLAKKYGLSPGDAFVVSDFEFSISGVSEGAAAFFTPFAFARYDDLIDFYLESEVAADITSFPLLSFLLVELVPGADPSEVARAIEGAVPQGDVYTPEELAARDKALARALFGPILQFLIDVGYVIGVLVAGMILFATVNARRREFGVLKALGFGHGYVRGVVVAEALALAILAIPLGVGLAGWLGWLIEETVPLYRILSTGPDSVIRTAVACVVFTAAGAMMPVRLIRGLDPASVFRA